MTTITLDPPKPVTTLKPTVVPQLTVRATILGDSLNAFGMQANEIRIAQDGFAEGLIHAVSIKGLDANGYVADEAVLRFDAIKQEAQMTVDMSGGRSMTEAVSRLLARHIVYSADLMKRKGLRITFMYWFPSHVNAAMACARFGLSPGFSPGYAPGHAPRQLFSVTPGADTGVHFAHYQSRRTG